MSVYNALVRYVGKLYRPPSEADALIALSREKGLVLQVGHLQRYNPAFGGVAAREEAPLFVDIERLRPVAVASLGTLATDAHAAPTPESPVMPSQPLAARPDEPLPTPRPPVDRASLRR